MSPPARVAIIGGGCGGITAAWELSRPEMGGRYEVTLFQEGWRLGGKGASGRGPSGRIEEHGLHVWLGYYENSFRMMRQCHAALAAEGDSPFGDWREAFVPEPDIGLMAPDGKGGWGRWQGRFPPAPGLPGDPDPPAMTLLAYMLRAIGLLETLILDVEARPSAAGNGAPRPASADDVAAAITRLLSRGVFAGALVAAEGLALLRAAITLMPPAAEGLVVGYADRLLSGLRQWLEGRILAQHHLAHVHVMAELVIATLIGMLKDGLLFDPRGLDAIDDEDSREWLRRHGASDRALASPFMTGLYDLAMAYRRGDPAQPGFAAGLGLRATLRLFFGYRSAVFWRMRAGMGDVVFAPLHECLARRGVRFEFFHRLTNVGLSADGSHVAHLDFDVQAQVREGRYRPLVEVAGRPCWPAAPDYAQLVDGDRLAREGRAFECHWDRRREDTRRLNVQEDFDFVVLATSIGAIPHVAAELVARDSRWRDMVTHVETVATQAFQIWLKDDIDRLGWKGPPHIATAFAKPFDTWCDMAHVIPEEAWADPPATAVYFCAVLPDEETAGSAGDAGWPQRARAEVRRNAIEHLEGPMRHVLPGAYDPDGSFRWELLADAHSAAAAQPAGQSRFDTQYWRANVSPSERYVLSLPGSTRYRLSPLDMTCDNLTIAGDWTACGLNSGCTESAVMSGMLAAHAISGLPELKDITGFDHP